MKVRLAISYIFKSKKPDRWRDFQVECVKEGIGPRKVPKEVATRWNTVYDSLSVAYTLRVPITSYFNRKVAEVYHLEESDWQNVERLLLFLAKFFYATKEFSGQYYPTITTMLYFIAGISELLNDYRVVPGYEVAVEAMIEKFKKYFFPIPPLYYIASVLHPCFKRFNTEMLIREIYRTLRITDEETPSVETVCAQVIPDCQRIYERYRSAADNVVPSVPSGAGSSSTQAPKRAATGLGSFSSLNQRLSSRHSSSSGGFNELDVYLLHACKDVDYFGSEQLLPFWKDQQAQFPVLAKMARDILTIQASSVASESAFSQGRLQIGDHRHSLKEEAMETAVLFRDWIRSERRNFGFAEDELADGEAASEILSGDGSLDNETEYEEDDSLPPVPPEVPEEIIQKMRSFFINM